jgi:hypothetical protein
MFFEKYVEVHMDKLESWIFVSKDKWILWF